MPMLQSNHSKPDDGGPGSRHRVTHGQQVPDDRLTPPAGSSSRRSVVDAAAISVTAPGNELAERHAAAAAGVRRDSRRPSNVGKSSQFCF